MPHDWNALKAAFPFEEINWRASQVSKKNPQQWKTRPLAYLDARNVMDRLDEVVGPESWDDRYYEARGLLVCAIDIKSDDRVVSKSDGAGDTDIEEEKGALSGAFKRAGVRWGIGRYLYGLKDLPWVEMEMYEQKGQWKSSGKIAKHELAKLRNIYDAFVSGEPAPSLPHCEGPSENELKQARIKKQIEDCKPWHELAKFMVDLCVTPEAVENWWGPKDGDTGARRCDLFFQIPEDIRNLFFTTEVQTYRSKLIKDQAAA